MPMCKRQAEAQAAQTTELRMISCVVDARARPSPSRSAPVARV
jgi:hypothetical protein